MFSVVTEEALKLYEIKQTQFSLNKENHSLNNKSDQIKILRDIYVIAAQIGTKVRKHRN